YTIDPVARTVSFATSHFSSFRVGATGAPTDRTLRTVADLDEPVDICEAYPPPGKPARYRFLVADKDVNTVIGLVPRSDGIGTLDAETFAGDGDASTDGAQRLNFAFPADVTAVASRRDGQVFVATRAQIFRIAANGAVSRLAGTGA